MSQPGIALFIAQPARWNDVFPPITAAWFDAVCRNGLIGQFSLAVGARDFLAIAEMGQHPAFPGGAVFIVSALLSAGPSIVADLSLFSSHRSTPVKSFVITFVITDVQTSLTALLCSFGQTFAQIIIVIAIPVAAAMMLSGQ